MTSSTIDLTKLAYPTRETAAEASYQTPWARPRVNVVVDIPGHAAAHNMPGKLAGDYFASALGRVFHPIRIEKVSDEVVSRLKKRQRGWHTASEPGFHDVNAKFEEAARKNGETKLASTDVKLAAAHAALARFGVDPKYAGIITVAPDPVGTLTQILKKKDFGYGKAEPEAGARNHSSFESWGAPTGLSADDAGGRLSGGAGAGYRSGTGMNYGGV